MKSKCIRIGVLIKAFYKCIKPILALKVKKSIPENLTFIKLACSKSSFLDLVNVDFLDLIISDFLDLAKFATVDKFLIFLSIS